MRECALDRSVDHSNIRAAAVFLQIPLFAMSDVFE